jgi:hypothetical protein
MIEWNKNLNNSYFLNRLGSIISAAIYFEKEKFPI